MMHSKEVHAPITPHLPMPARTLTSLRLPAHTAGVCATAHRSAAAGRAQQVAAAAGGPAHGGGAREPWGGGHAGARAARGALRVYSHTGCLCACGGVARSCACCSRSVCPRLCACLRWFSGCWGTDASTCTRYKCMRERTRASGRVLCAASLLHALSPRISTRCAYE